MRTAVLILAGGAASRMQRPKMLLPLGNSTVLQKILTETEAILPSKLFVITGCYHDEIVAAGIDPSLILYNEAWTEGMASSIRKGLTALQQEEDGFDAVLIIVSDQPFLHSGLLNQMLQLKKQTGKGIVTATYQGIKGTPVLFDRKYVDALLQLHGDAGAKLILKLHPDDLIAINFPEGAMDIDTPEDYKKVLSSYLSQRC